MILFHTGDTGNTELKKYISANISFKVDHMAPQLKAISDKFLKDILGKDELNLLIENFDDDILTAEQELLLPYCQDVLANLAVLSFTPTGSLYFGAMGLSVPQADGVAPISQWRMREFKNEYASSGFNAIEKLLFFLWESNAGEYPDWEESAERDKHLKYFINSAKEFSEHFWIDDMYQLFRMFKPTMSNVEKYYIKPILGKELFAAIKTEILENNISAENETLLNDYIRPATAQITFFEAAPRLRLDVSGFGISQNKISDKLSDDAKDSATEIAYADGVTTSERTGQIILADLREFLYENVADYPLYESSPEYIQKNLEAENKLTNNDPINNTDRHVAGMGF